MGYLDTLNKELNKKASNGGLLSVKLTDTLGDLTMSYENFADANAIMLESTTNLEMMIDSIGSLEHTMSVISTSKLQPSVCKMLSYEVGFESISGISLADVTNANRDQLSTEAFENMTAKAKSAWKKVKEFFQKIWENIKKFFRELFDTTLKQQGAIKKLNDGVLTKLKWADKKAFDTAEVTGYTRDQYNNVADAIKELGIWGAKVAAGIAEEGSANMPKFSKFGIPFVFDGKVWEKKGDSKWTKTKGTLKEKGWTLENVKAEVTTISAMLSAINKLKIVMDATGKAISDLEKDCDYLVVNAGEKNDSTKTKTAKEKIAKGKVLLAALTKGLSVYTNIARSFAAEYIVICSKIKLNKDADEKSAAAEKKAKK